MLHLLPTNIIKYLHIETYSEVFTITGTKISPYCHTANAWPKWKKRARKKRVKEKCLTEFNPSPGILSSFASVMTRIPTLYWRDLAPGTDNFIHTDLARTNFVIVFSLVLLTVLSVLSTQYFSQFLTPSFSQHLPPPFFLLKFLFPVFLLPACCLTSMKFLLWDLLLPVFLLYFYIIFNIIFVNYFYENFPLIFPKYF